MAVSSTEPKELSSLPLTIGLASAIVVCTFLGWLLLKDSAVPGDAGQRAPGTTLATTGAAPSDAVPAGVDGELRKARLAVEADLLVSPAERNALYFYARVLAAEPQHPVAKAELDALLATISLRIDDHLAAGEFDAAYELASQASLHRPGHPLSAEMNGALNAYVAAIADQASRLAMDGRDDDALAVLGTLESLPGVGGDYIAASRQDVLEIQQARASAEQRSREDAQRAEEQAELEAAQRVRDAIAAGHLIAPEGKSAQDYLAQLDAGSKHREEPLGDLRIALFTSIESLLADGALEEAEARLAAARALGFEGEALAALSADYDEQLIEQERSKVMPLTEFVQLNVTPARYPNPARQADTTGWVEVAFTVTSTGRTADIEIIRAEPEEVFDLAVITAVESWTFVPRQFRGRSIDQRTAARLVFNLE